jgi:hypothetical protein
VGTDVFGVFAGEHRGQDRGTAAADPDLAALNVPGEIRAARGTGPAVAGHLLAGADLRAGQPVGDQGCTVCSAGVRLVRPRASAPARPDPGWLPLGTCRFTGRCQ